MNIGDRPFSVFVDEGTGRILGTVEDGCRIGEVATRVHGTLLMGTLGDWLIELAASLGILMIATGLNLWFPGRRRQSPRSGGGPQLAWRLFHRTTGALMAPELAFYLISGLAWTGVWGEKLVTLGAAQAPPGGGSTSHHEALNSGSEKVVPWNWSRPLCRRPHRIRMARAPSRSTRRSRRRSARVSATGSGSACRAMPWACSPSRRRL